MAEKRRPGRACAFIAPWCMLTFGLILAWAGPQTARAQMIWTGDPFPANYSDLPFLPNMTHSTIHQATVDYQYLHGVAIIEHNGVFYTSWENSPTGEHSTGAVTRGRRSYDFGQTWDPVELIASHPTLLQSHGAFISHNGELWAMSAQFVALVYDPYTHYPQAATTIYKLDTNGQWQDQGQAVDGMFMLNAPKPMSNGNWVAGGFNEYSQPCVAISQGSNFTSPWTRVDIPTTQPPTNPMRFGETDVWVNGIELTAVIRNQNFNNDHAPYALTATSTDGGLTWTTAQVSNMPMHAAKPFAGELSTGQRFLVCNIRDRDLLVIAAGAPGELTLRKVWKIRDEPSPVPQFPAYYTRQWSYPWAIEHNGNLYVLYSSSKEDAVMTVIPVADLAVAAPPPATLVNGSFEDMTGYGTLPDGTLNGSDERGTPPGWNARGNWDVDGSLTQNLGRGGVMEANYTHTPNDPVDGDYVGYMVLRDDLSNPTNQDLPVNTLWQPVADDLQADSLYTLTFHVANRVTNADYDLNEIADITLRAFFTLGAADPDELTSAVGAAYQKVADTLVGGVWNAGQATFHTRGLANLDQTLNIVLHGTTTNPGVSVIRWDDVDVTVHELTDADADADGDVDAADVAAFVGCTSGPAIPLTGGCELHDHDGDNDVDQVDFGVVQRCFGGADVPVGPDCAN